MLCMRDVESKFAILKIRLNSYEKIIYVIYFSEKKAEEIKILI